MAHNVLDIASTAMKKEGWDCQKSGSGNNVKYTCTKNGLSYNVEMQRKSK